MIKPDLKVEIDDVFEFNGEVAELNGETWHVSGWRDISADVLARTVTARHGIFDFEPSARIASEGRATFYLNNSVTNSAATMGYYTPGHASAMLGWEENVQVRLSFSHSGYNSGTAVPKWWGYISKIEPAAGQYRDRYVYVDAVDFMALMNENEQAAALPIMEDITSDQGYTQLVGSMVRQPQGTEFAVGKDVIPYYGHRSGQKSGSVYEEASRLAQSVFDYLFVDGRGYLVSQTRHSRIQETTVQFTLTGTTLMNVSVSNDRSRGFDRIVTVTYPVAVGTSEETAFELEDPIRLNPGDSYTLYADYTDPTSSRPVGITNPTTLVAGTHYKFGSGGNMSDQNLNSSLGVSITWGAAQAKVVFTNNGTRLGYVNMLVLKGYLVRFDNPVKNEYVKNDTGNRVLNLDLPYQQSSVFAENANKMIGSVYGSRRVATASYRANTATLFADFMDSDLGERIAVTETVTGLDAVEAFINGREWQYRPGGELVVTEYLAPATTTESGIWGVSTWGEGAVWKFAEG